MHALLRFVYPLYCLTGVEDFDYHFIGTCFPLVVDDRMFVTCSMHQIDIAQGLPILVASPSDTSKFFGVDNKAVVRFPMYDLAIFEVASEDRRLFFQHSLSVAQFANFPEGVDAEYAALGCLTELNAIDHDNKEIRVSKSALITEAGKLTQMTYEFDFSDLYMLVCQGEKLDRLTSFHERTQGLSGSPVVAFSIAKDGTEKGEIELQIVGVSTHVAESKSILYATPYSQLMAALHYSFGIFEALVDDQKGGV